VYRAGDGRRAVASPRQSGHTALVHAYRAALFLFLHLVVRCLHARFQ
jgi:hypothetical protein